MISYKENENVWDLTEATDKEMELLIKAGQLLTTMIIGARVIEATAAASAERPSASEAFSSALN